MPIKEGLNIRVGGLFQSSTKNKNLAMTFYYFYKFISIPSLVLHGFLYKYLFLQSFLVSIFHFQSNSTMKFVIFQASPLSFLFSFNSVYVIEFSKYFFA